MVCSSILVILEPVGLIEKVYSELRLNLKDFPSLPVSQAGVVGFVNIRQRDTGTLNVRKIQFIGV